MTHHRPEHGPLQHHAAVLELSNEAFTALTGSVGDLRNLVGVVFEPRSTSKGVEEDDDVFGMDEINEGVSDVAAVVEVHAEVHEVVQAVHRFIEQGFQLIL